MAAVAPEQGGEHEDNAREQAPAEQPLARPSSGSRSQRHLRRRRPGQRQSAPNRFLGGLHAHGHEGSPFPVPAEACPRRLTHLSRPILAAESCVLAAWPIRSKLRGPGAPLRLLARLATGQTGVEVVRAGAGERRDDARGRARPGAGLDQPAQGVDREGGVGARAGAASGGAITTTISPFTSSRKRRASSESVPRAISSWSLVSSRQTAAGRSGASVASAASESGSRRGDSKATTVSPPGEHPLELAGAARQEALEAPAVRGQPRGDKGGDHGRGTGQDLDVEPTLDAGTDEAVPGIGDDRASRRR